jgi:hypothetical protein
MKRFLLTMIVLNALFLYGIGDTDMTNTQFAFGMLVVNSLLIPMAIMLTLLMPKTQQK